MHIHVQICVYIYIYIYIPKDPKRAEPDEVRHVACSMI